MVFLKQLQSIYSGFYSNNITEQLLFIFYYDHVILAYGALGDDTEFTEGVIRGHPV